MLIVGFIFVLLVIAAMVLLGGYVINRDPKYLNAFKKVVQYLLYLMLMVVVLFVVRRLL